MWKDVSQSGDESSYGSWVNSIEQTPNINSPVLDFFGRRVIKATPIVLQATKKLFREQKSLSKENHSSTIQQIAHGIMKMQGGGYDPLSKEEYRDLFYCLFEETVENVAEISAPKWTMVVVVPDADP